MKASDILEQQLRDETLWLDNHDEAIAELKTLENRSCDNCKYSTFEVKFGELEFNACF